MNGREKKTYYDKSNGHDSKNSNDIKSIPFEMMLISRTACQSAHGNRNRRL